MTTLNVSIVEFDESYAGGCWNCGASEFLYTAEHKAEDAAANAAYDAELEEDDSWMLEVMGLELAEALNDGPDPIWEAGGYGYGEMVDGKFDMYAEWVDYDVDDCGDED